MCTYLPLLTILACFFFSGIEVNALADTANSAFSNLYEWTKNALQVIVAETKPFIFRTKHKKVTLTQDISFNSVYLNLVPTFNALSVVFNEKMTSDDHIYIIAKKLSQIIGLLCRYRHLLPSRAILEIYHSPFKSHLNCSNLVWGKRQKKTSKS